QQQDALADFEALRGRLEVLDDARDGLLDAEEFGGEELVARDLVAGALVQLLHAGSVNHVVDARVRKLGEAWVLRDQLEVVAEASLPRERCVLLAQRFEPR